MRCSLLSCLWGTAFAKDMNGTRSAGFVTARKASLARECCEAAQRHEVLAEYQQRLLRWCMSGLAGHRSRTSAR